MRYGGLFDGWRSEEGALTKQSGAMPLSEAVRLLALSGIFGALIGLISLALPHTDPRNEIGLLFTNGFLIVAGIAILAAPSRWPPSMVRALPAVAVGTATMGTIFSGDPTTPIAIFYLWAPIWALMFLSRTAFLLTSALAAVSAITVFALLGGPEVATTAERVRGLVAGGGTVLFICALLIYQRERMERAFQGLADASRTDLLTELPNAQGMNTILAAEQGRAIERGASMSAMIVDLDRFRAVNEELGHERGDAVLRKVAGELREALGADGRIGRTGPSEFTVALPESDESDAHLVAEKMLRTVSDHQAATALTASIGVASFPRHARTVEEQLKNARRALDAARALGRDRVVVISAEVTGLLTPPSVRQLNSAAHFSTLIALAEALNLRDSGTSEHCEQVAHYAKETAIELGFNGFQVERVRVAGMLHDIGKVGVPDEIISKAGPLNEGDWEELRKHPEIAARILGTRELADIREWILASQERPDGTGYPRGLSGGEIPLAARIIAVTNAYAEMQRERPNRPILSEALARRELERCAGTQFDRRVVDAFFRVLDRESRVREDAA